MQWLLAEGLFRSGLYVHVKGLQRKRAMLMFHSILPERNLELHLRNNSIAELTRTVHILKRMGSIVSVKQWMEESEPNQFAITFDDGLLNNLNYAAPALAKLHVPASYYINTSYVAGNAFVWPEKLSLMTRDHKGTLHARGQYYIRHAHNRWLNRDTASTMVSDWMSLSMEDIEHALNEIEIQCGGMELLEAHRVMKGEEIKILSAMPGVTIGSHGVDHRDMTTLSEADLRDTLLTSKTYLEQCTNQKVDELAFPFGATNAFVCDIARKQGYTHLIGVNAEKASPQIAMRYGIYNHLPISIQLKSMLSE